MDTPYNYTINNNCKILQSQRLFEKCHLTILKSNQMGMFK